MLETRNKVLKYEECTGIYTVDIGNTGMLEPELLSCAIGQIIRGTAFCSQ